MSQEREQTRNVRTNARVNLLEAGQARVCLERQSQLFSTNIADCVLREAVAAWICHAGKGVHNKLEDGYSVGN
jgi:hypothetical protein